MMMVLKDMTFKVGLMMMMVMMMMMMMMMMMIVLKYMTFKVGLMAQTGSVYLTVCVAIERCFLHVLETQLRNIKHPFRILNAPLAIQLMIS